MSENAPETFYSSKIINKTYEVILVNKANEIYKIHLGAAKCALDIGDGSERGEYVNQDYILNVLGRPHRSVGIMYTYYPKDLEWSDKRISVTCKDMEITYQWDYPYDDYYPYRQNGEPFEQMRDIRRHGQDVFLTLTIDCSLDDDELRKIARELKPYGRMRLRVNHECAGDWFTHNRRFSYEEVGAFFVRFANIIKEEAPNIKTVFCAGFVRGENKTVECEDAFTAAYRAADEWSGDAYLALHFGWPFDIAEKGGASQYTANVDENFEMFRKTFKRLTMLNGDVPKPMITAELNTDGDLTGSVGQGESVKRFYHKIRDEKAEWFKSVSLYQFRDRGRLGLEVEDPNNSQVGIPQPILDDYREILADPYFSPEITIGETAEFPIELRWGSAEDSDGFAMKLKLEKTPVFCEVTFSDPLSLMMELNGKWFYKSPSVKTVDLMPAFFNSSLSMASELTLKIFATPPEGVNIDNGSLDWAENYLTTLNTPPELRIRYESVGEVG